MLGLFILIACFNFLDVRAHPSTLADFEAELASRGRVIEVSQNEIDPTWREKAAAFFKHGTSGARYSKANYVVKRPDGSLETIGVVVADEEKIVRIEESRPVK